MTALVLVPRRRSTADLALRTAARGAILIGVAVVIGIVLLQVVDNGGGGGGSVAPPVTNGTDGSTTSTTGDDGRPVSEVRVMVLNASGLANAASTKSNELRALGYPQAGTGNAPLQTGSTVACRSGFEKEADALARTLGAGYSVIPFPDPPPEGVDVSNADCLVILGS